MRHTRIIKYNIEFEVDLLLYLRVIYLNDQTISMHNVRRIKYYILMHYIRGFQTCFLVSLCNLILEKRKTSCDLPYNLYLFMS